MIGKMLADADGEKQGAILNSWVHQLEDGCRRNNASASDQNYYIGKHLTERTAEWLEDLVESWQFHRDSAKDRQLETDRIYERQRDAQSRLDDLNDAIERAEKNLGAL